MLLYNYYFFTYLIDISIKGVINLSNLSNVIKETRESRKMSVRRFANLAELSPAYVLALEKSEEHSPTIETLRKIARVLKISLLELMIKAGYFNED